MSAALSEVGAKQYLLDISKQTHTDVSLKHNREDFHSLILNLTLKMAVIDG